jgi:hypothetical protein
LNRAAPGVEQTILDAFAEREPAHSRQFVELGDDPEQQVVTGVDRFSAVGGAGSHGWIS